MKYIQNTRTPHMIWKKLYNINPPSYAVLRPFSCTNYPSIPIPQKSPRIYIMQIYKEYFLTCSSSIRYMPVFSYLHQSLDFFFLFVNATGFVWINDQKKMDGDKTFTVYLLYYFDYFSLLFLRWLSRQRHKEGMICI